MSSLEDYKERLIQEAERKLERRAAEAAGEGISFNRQVEYETAYKEIQEKLGKCTWDCDDDCKKLSCDPDTCGDRTWFCDGVPLKDINYREAELKGFVPSVVTFEPPVTFCPCCFEKNPCRCNKMRTSYQDKWCPPANIVDLMASAIKHSKNVARRDRVKADRVERVGIFVNSLRTFVGGRGINNLCRADIWYDIGVMDHLGKVPPRDVSFDQIQEWLDAAKFRVRNTDDEYIEESLKELETHFKGASLAVADMEKINQQADDILNSLRNTLQEI